MDKPSKKLLAKWNKRLAKEGLAMTAGLPRTRAVKLIYVDPQRLDTLPGTSATQEDEC